MHAFIFLFVQFENNARHLRMSFVFEFFLIILETPPCLLLLAHVSVRKMRFNCKTCDTDVKNIRKTITSTNTFCAIVTFLYQLHLHQLTFYRLWVFPLLLFYTIAFFCHIGLFCWVNVLFLCICIACGLYLCICAGFVASTCTGKPALY
jgi:hypothetical protein